MTARKPTIAVLDIDGTLVDTRRCSATRSTRAKATTSARPRAVDYYLDLLDARGIVGGWTTSDDVQQTKPAPDLITAAITKVGGGKAVMVGDSTWDCEAAKRARVLSVAVLTGGFSSEELEAAGAHAVYGSIDELRQQLTDSPLGAA